MRLYIKSHTEKAYLLFGSGFVERWVPKSAVSIKPNSFREGVYGPSYEMEIAKWFFRINNTKKANKDGC